MQLGMRSGALAGQLARRCDVRFLAVPVGKVRTPSAHAVDGRES
jgi:hypothetical protein